MRGLILTLAAGLAALAGQPAPPAPAPPAVPVVAFRTRLTAGDPDRNWTYVSAADGTLPLVWTANGKPVQPWPLPLSEEWYDANYHGGYTLPADAKPGTLTLDCGHGLPGQLQVVAAPVRKAIILPPNTAAGSVQAYLSLGYTDITLSAGLHQWDRMVTLPAGAKLSGYGATLKRLPANPYGGNWPLLLVTGPDVSVYGLTFVNDQPGGVALEANPSQPGLVVAECTFNRCVLGFYFTQALVRDCTFSGGGAIIAPGGLYWRCTFNGPSVVDPWQGWGADHWQMVDCFFRGTCRGPVFNAQGGSINDPFFSGVECHGIVRGNNGNECWLCEGGPVNRLVALHCRVMGCDSASFQFDGGSTDTYVRDFVQDGGFGVVLTSWNKGATATNFTLQDFELRRCGIYCGPNVSGFKAIDGAIIGWHPTRGNQTWANPSSMCASRTVAALAEGPNAGTNTLTRVPVLGLPAGFTGVQGLTVTPVPVGK